MKILHVITGLGQGGAEAVLYRLISASKSAHEHSVISLLDEGVYGEKFAQIGVPVDCLNIRGASDFVRGISDLRKVIKNQSPDVIQTWMYHADLVGGLAGKLEGVPVCWGLHNSNFEKRYTKRQTRLVVKLCSFMSGFVPTNIVSCSKTARDLHVEVGYVKEKFYIIPNGLDFFEFKPDNETGRAFRSSLNLPEDSKLITNVARFHPQKDHVNLIRAFHHAFSSDSSVHLVLCGTGMTKDNLEIVDLISKKNISSRVHLLGARNDVPKVLAGSDLFVLSSVGEAFPCVVAEAMACEIPCVVTDVGDCAEIVGSTGWVVPPLAFEALAIALTAALRDESRSSGERGRAAREVVIEKYGVGKMVSSYESVWRKSMSKSRME